MANPDTLPPSILFNHTETCLTIHDAFPKAMFHFLVLPRIRPPMNATNLTNLHSLLKCKKKVAKAILKELSNEANSVTKMIQEEMMSRYGFLWDIWVGFHPVPSMEHLHLHVISSDLCSPKLKIKKHYNSFHPMLGFFLHVTDVLSWFEADPSYYEMMSELKKSMYDPLLKEDLACWKCDRAMKNMPTLKAHLQEEWDNEARKQKAKIERKRKRDELQGDDTEEPLAKRSPVLPDDTSAAS